MALQGIENGVPVYLWKNARFNRTGEETGLDSPDHISGVAGDPDGNAYYTCKADGEGEGW